MIDCKTIEWEFESRFMKINIPIATYSFPNAEKIKKDLVSIVDHIENFYYRQKPDSITIADGSTNLSSIVSHNFMHYNIFDFDDTNSVKLLEEFFWFCVSHYKTQILKTEEKNYYYQCWANKMSHLDYVSDHQHTKNEIGSHLLSANYFLQSAQQTSYTIYTPPSRLLNYKFKSWDESEKPDQFGRYHMKNVEGDLTIFPAFVSHGTSAVRGSKQKRYTFGLDILEQQTEQDLDIRRGCWRKKEIE